MILEWKKVENEVFDNVPVSSGVYIISTMQKIDRKYEVKYIGQAKNLKNRVIQHWSANESNEELKSHISKNYRMKFSYAIVSSQGNRDAIELFLYRKFNPKFNNNQPPGDRSMIVNLPEVRGKI